MQTLHSRYQRVRDDEKVQIPHCVRDDSAAAPVTQVKDADTPGWIDGPPGSTPLDPDEADGLIPSHITTQGELNAWEQLNIARADTWAISRRRRRAAVILTSGFAEELHRRMFDQTWNWAGTYRLTGKSIGVPSSQIHTALHDRLADAVHWISDEVFELDEIAARLHHQLVLVHPWPNGNGRWSRLIADALLHAGQRPRFSWGAGDLVRATDARVDYLAALRAADRGDLAPLLAFVRR
jgi:Fic-DOC domain mobile mystery protein B